MAKKRKKRRSPGGKTSLALTPEKLLQQARQALENGHYRDAIAHFKALLKQEECPEWRNELATAYQGRARELADKGMLKEALAIAEVRSELCPEAPPDPDHITRLLHAGRVGDAIKAYRQIEKRFPSRERARINAQFAAIHLSGAPEVEQILDAQHPIIAHGISARAALAAYCGGEDEASSAALGAIPFRSPYRDWVQVMKALLKRDQGTEAVRTLLDRIAPDSPFAALANATRLSLLPQSALPDALAQTGEAAQGFVTALQGWNETRLSLWRELQTLADPSRPQTLITLMIKHRQALGDTWVRRQALPLLATDFPLSIEQRSALLDNRAPSNFEQALIAAWGQENNKTSSWTRFTTWRHVIDQLRTSPPPAPDSDKALRIALIQRLFDTRWDLLNTPSNPFEDESLEDQVLDQLEESLTFDPGYQATYTRLVAYYRGKESLKEARRILDRALKIWPDEPPVLIEALETAAAGGAFKKAAGFARRLLELDPINTTARSALLEAHLAHARKQHGKGRDDLALKELEHAGEWAKGTHSKARLTLLCGFVTWEQEQQAGAALLQEAVESLGGALDGQLALALEAERLGQSLDRFLEHLRLPQLKQPEHGDLMQFLRRLREALETGQVLSVATRQHFEPTLERAAKLDLTHGDVEAICETLGRADLNQARLAHARAALKRWPNTPLFELHRFEAKYEGTYWDLEEGDIDRLKQSYQQAQENGDMRIVVRLRTLLDDLGVLPTPGYFFEDEDDYGDIYDDIDDDINAMEPFPPEARAMLDSIGIEEIMDMIANSELGEGLKDMEQALGHEGTAAMLEAMLSGASPEEMLGAITPDPHPPRPKARSHGRKPKGKGKGKGKRTDTKAATPAEQANDDPDADDETPQFKQLDLF